MSFLPVSVTELSTPASVNALDCELSARPTPTNAFNYELSVCPVTVEGHNYRQSVYPASITELSVNPIPVNAPNCELSVGLNYALKLDSELFVFPVSTNKPECELSACESVYKLPARSIVTRETMDELFMFPALALGPKDALSVSCVSVFPRSQSLPWSTVPSALVWWSSAPSAPPLHYCCTSSQTTVPIIHCTDDTHTHKQLNALITQLIPIRHAT